MKGTGTTEWYGLMLVLYIAAYVEMFRFVRWLVRLYKRRRARIRRYDGVTPTGVSRRPTQTTQSR